MVKRIHKTDTPSLRGFSLVEFVVVLTIFSIMSLIALFNYRDFQSTTAVKNLAYDVALSIRQAQTFGTAASDVDNPLAPTTASPADDKSIYGIVFRNNTTFSLFLDSNRNYFFGAADGLIETKKILGGGSISDICVGNDSGSCGTIGSNGLVITFQRPLSDAIIKDNPEAPSGPSYAYAEIVLQSPFDSAQQKKVVVWASGAIDVEDI